MKKVIKKTKGFWLYIVLGVLLILGALILVPYWGKLWPECPWKDWGLQLVSYSMAALILIYLFGFLIKKIAKSSGKIQILTVLEFTFLALIALGLIFSQLKILNIPDSPSIILGIALYIRGVIEIFRAYYHNNQTSNDYPFSMLIVAILFVTFGVVLMITDIVTKIMVLLSLIIVLIALGIYSIVYGALAKPDKKTQITKK